MTRCCKSRNKEQEIALTNKFLINFVLHILKAKSLIDFFIDSFENIHRNIEQTHKLVIVNTHVSFLPTNISMKDVFGWRYPFIFTDKK